MKKTILDDLKTIKKYDKSDMLGTLESFPEQCLRAKDIGLSFALPAAFKGSCDNIVCTGLGGSAIGSDIARSYAADDSKVPIFVNRNYTLPDFVDEKSIVIAVSYSGNTEETLSAYRQARDRKSKIIAVTSGGELKKAASVDGFPVLEIPDGLQPRCALGYSFFPLLILLSKIGIIGGQSEQIGEAITVLRDLRDKRLSMSVPKGKNISKKIAESLYMKFPVIYAAQDHTDCVITRWRGELAENAKTLSSGHVIPEMNHNEIVGWEFPRKLLKNFTAVILRNPGESERISKRLDITEKILKKEGLAVIKVESIGKGLLARIFSLIYIGDFVSFYLAMLNNIDPTPVERINYLKKELSKA